MSENGKSAGSTKRRRRFDPASFLATVAKDRSIATHRNKEIIFTQGSAADSVFYIKKGKVKVTVVSKQGKEAVVAILGVGEFVGEGCLSGQSRRLATASAMTECVTMRVAKKEIQRVIRDEPAFPKCLCLIFWREMSALKRTCSISSLTQLRNGSPGCCCCWPILARKVDRSPSSRKSVRRRSLK